MVRIVFKKSIFLILIATIVVVFLGLIAGPPIFRRPNVDLLITNAQVVTLDAENHIYEKGWIAINDGKIIAMNSGENSAYIGRKNLDAAGKIALPGLINTHSHAAMTLLRGLADSKSLPDWLKTISLYEQDLTAEDVYLGTLLAASEMIRSGTTTFNDMYFFPEAAAKAVTQAGMRAVLRIPINQHNQELTFDETLVKKNQDNALISFSLAPNPLLNFSLEQLEKISDYALEHDYLVHLHFAETKVARVETIELYGKTPLQFIADSGLLRNRLVLAHGVDLTATELDLIAPHSKVGIAYNPKSNLKLTAETADVPAMLKEGITVGIGTDGAASSNSLDLFSQINFAVFGFLKCQEAETYCQDQYTVSPEKVLRMATIDGAKLLGLEGSIGSLEIGKQADLILINLQQPHLVPSYDIYSTLVYNTTGADVTESIINGHLVMEQGEVTTFDEGIVLDQVNARARLIEGQQQQVN